MPLLPLIGHTALRTRFSAAIARGTFPASLLLHGPRGAGKERLALWTGARMLCANPGADGEPCGTCQHCQYIARGAHPDLHWYFPRPKGKKDDPDPDEVLEDFAEATQERLEKTGVWEATASNHSFFRATMRAIVRRAGLTPALAARKVIVIADAHRLVAQEGSEEAANAFLKLLEEPLADTTIILTTSSRGALLPTIQSRVVSIRVPPLTADDARALAEAGVNTDPRAAGRVIANSMLDAATRDAAARYRTALMQGAAGARGEFSVALEALTALLHERSRAAAINGKPLKAANAARAIAFVEDAARLARQNVSPQLLTATMLDEIAPLVS